MGLPQAEEAVLVQYRSVTDGRRDIIAIYTVFRKKHPLVFSCVTLKRSNQFE